jgi:hypothetical protein
LYSPNPGQETLICNAIAATTALGTDTNLVGFIDALVAESGLTVFGQIKHSTSGLKNFIKIVR